MKKNITVILGLGLAAVMFSACIGLKTGIDVKKNGGGTIEMEYRVSNELLSMGSQAGNEDFPPLPVGEQDFERTFDRIPGIKMTSYSEKEDGDDSLFLIKAKFDNLKALVNFLDSQGRQAAVEIKDGKTFFSISFDVDDKDIDPDFVQILPVVFEDYYMEFTIKLPNKCEVSYLGPDGEKLPGLPYGETAVTSDTVDFSSSMAELFSSGGASSMVISW
ncbi:MAG: hypothetical protein LBC27_06420 [Spirochaetaceae bacterium]|jgi:hypothetical protein|nr:hypothetical protein [Spirochaetaceae bacterium]